MHHDHSQPGPHDPPHGPSAFSTAHIRHLQYMGFVLVMHGSSMPAARHQH